MGPYGAGENWHGQLNVLAVVRTIPAIFVRCLYDGKTISRGIVAAFTFMPVLCLLCAPVYVQSRWSASGRMHQPCLITMTPTIWEFGQLNTTDDVKEPLLQPRLVSKKVVRVTHAREQQLDVTSLLERLPLHRSTRRRDFVTSCYQDPSDLRRVIIRGSSIACIH